MTRHAAIVGAGIGGLSAALALSRAGYSVEIFEKAPALGEVGAGLQMSPNAMKALAWLGVSDAVIAAGFEPLAAVMRHHRTGAAYMNAPLAAACRRRYGAPYIHIHRADLHMILAKAAKDSGAQIHLAAAVEGYQAGGTELQLVDGRVIKANIVIGADGVRSVIRNQMLGNDPPRFTGQVAWRGLAPAARLPKDLIAPDATVWVGPGRHFVTYCLRGGNLVNFVAVEERTDWRDDSWTQPGDRAELRAAFEEWAHPVTALLDAAEDVHLWALFDRPPLSLWSDGAACLLGDACHPTLPFMAQGAAMAIEDAVVLARCLEVADPLVAFKRYEALRKPRTTSLQRRARSNADLFHRSGIIARAKLAAASALPQWAALRPLDPVYGYDPTT